MVVGRTRPIAWQEKTLSAPTLDRPSSTLAAVERPADVRGRSAECETLTRLAQMACAGQSQVLVVRGEAGIGKTALLDHLAQIGRASCRERVSVVV